MSEDKKKPAKDDEPETRIEEWDIDILRRRGQIQPHPLLDCPSCYWRLGQCRCWS